MKIFGAIILSLVALSLFIALWVPFLEAFRAVFGGFYVLIAPGFAMTYVFFKKEELTFLERLPFGFAFSLVTIPLLIFTLNRGGMNINPLSIFAVITGMIALTIFIVFLRHFRLYR